METNITKEKVMNLIRYSFWDNDCPEIDQNTYEEMKRQTIVALPAAKLDSCISDHVLLQTWKKTVL